MTAVCKGSVVIAGLGPGKDTLVTPEVQDALAQATDVVGYIPYVKRVAPREGLTVGLTREGQPPVPTGFNKEDIAKVILVSGAVVSLATALSSGTGAAAGAGAAASSGGLSTGALIGIGAGVAVGAGVAMLPEEDSLPDAECEPVV